MRKKIFVLVVILLAIFPGIGAFTGLGSMSDTEMMHHDGRTRQKIEGISDIPLWFEEGLGGRRWFLRLHSAILYVYDFFNQSTNEDSVQVGKEDFLFLGDAYNTSFSLHSGAQKYAQQTLEQTKRGYETFMGILAQKGIPSLFIIAPDKDVIYGEYYPSWVKKVDLSFPKEKLNIQGKLAKTVFLDYCLLKYKEQHNSPLLYYKSDTHWNALGGFVAYNAVMDAVADLWGRAVKRVVLKSMKLDPQQDPWIHDLKRMLGSTKEEKDYVVLELDSDNKANISVSSASLDKDGYVGSHISNVNSPNDMNVIIIHDSFYMHSQKAYRQTFKNITEIHLSNFTEECFNTVLQKKQKIDLVIIFLVERNVIGHAAAFERAAAQIARDSERGE